MWQLVTARVNCYAVFITTVLGTTGILQRILWLRMDLVLSALLTFFALHPIVCIVYLFSKKKDMDITFILIVLTLLWLLGLRILAAFDGSLFG
jgi:hypothetical protein